MSKYLYQSRDARNVTFESPTDPNSTFSFKRAITDKVVNKVPLTNIRSEAVVLRKVDPRGAQCTDCSPLLEPLSARLILSGSNPVELLAMWNTLRDNVDSQIDVMIHGRAVADNAILTIDPVAGG